MAEGGLSGEICQSGKADDRRFVGYVGRRLTSQPVEFRLTSLSESGRHSVVDGANACLTFMSSTKTGRVNTA